MLTELSAKENNFIILDFEFKLEPIVNFPMWVTEARSNVLDLILTHLTFSKPLHLLNHYVITK